MLLGICEPLSRSVSPAMLAAPQATSRAPLPNEFEQPVSLPSSELLPHGQAVPVPSPKQKSVKSPDSMHTDSTVGGDVLSRAVEMSRPLIDAREQSLDVTTVDAELPVLGDPVRLVQVVGNLLASRLRLPVAGRVEI